MALIPPFFLDCVVAIGFDQPNQTRQYTATGFLFGKLVNQKGDYKEYSIYLVTNKHVFLNNRKAWLRFNPEGNEPAQEFDLLLVGEKNEKKWLEHENQSIDLAIIQLSAPFLLKRGISFGYFRSDQNVLTRDGSLKLGLSEGDSVFVLGFPMGLVGEKRNYVIVRQGAIARIKDSLGGTSKDFLIDTTVLPGNSGGPVITKPEFVSIQGTQSISTAYLIGIVRSYVAYQDIAISSQTKRPRIVFEENSGLASVIPIDFVVEILDKVRITVDAQQQEKPLETTQVPPESPDPQSTFEMDEEE
jgi:S1-C subfamily serine protease